MLRELVPGDTMRAYQPEDWKKAIIAHYNRHQTTSKDDAKINFLKQVSKWPTFGSAFFEVKVCYHPNDPVKFQYYFLQLKSKLLNLSIRTFFCWPSTKLASWPLTLKPRQAVVSLLHASCDMDPHSIRPSSTHILSPKSQTGAVEVTTSTSPLATW